MSLILEALRKSESERRRAQAPDLFAPVLATAPAARRWRPAWWLVIAGIGLLAVAWWLLRALAPAPAGLPDTTPPRTSPPQVERRASPALDAPTAPAPPRRLPATAQPAPVPAPVAAAPSKPVPSPSARALAAADTAPANAPAPAAPPPTPDPIPAQSGPMRLSELDRASRQQLPPLKLTMHMWNEVAARRFVILDGRRLAEGDRAGAVRIVEIRHDGVLLDWNGQALQLPLR
jgi:general secretion pathway protein B